MRLNEIKDILNLKVLSGGKNIESDVTRGYVSDLMSDVIAHGKEGDIWITYQTHVNVVAIALMKNMAGVILIQNRELIPSAAEKAEQERLPVFSSSYSAFELAGKLYQLGIPG
jgi:predicted transcriptional regulator